MYSPTQDFLALLRQTSGGVRVERMPGLDFVVAALSRMGLFSVWVNPTTPPPSQQISTVWVKPSLASWSLESTIWLYNTSTLLWEPASINLWRIFLSQGTTDIFQSVAGAAGVVSPQTTLLAVQRNAPALTTLTLPDPNSRSRELRIIDFSTNVTLHNVHLVPSIGTIMLQPFWDLYSTVDQLTGITLFPSSNLNAWVIAP